MMKKYTFDAKNGLWYEQCGEYQLPCLTVPNSKMIGRWGHHHRRYLRQHKYGTYTALLLTGKLDDTLIIIMFVRTVLTVTAPRMKQEYQRNHKQFFSHNCYKNA
ncbi:TnpV protein [Butyricicoccus sp. OF27-2pH9A]|uniref:TnpV protein n=1 Tax=Butyricicoccus sp. OF27-2pH9A TaxID=3002517 RepID=UPI0022DEF874|nr:TnpV protein [Butyricicoccus sp. OF27-2pH9A]